MGTPQCRASPNTAKVENARNIAVSLKKEVKYSLTNVSTTRLALSLTQKKRAGKLRNGRKIGPVPNRIHCLDGKRIWLRGQAGWGRSNRGLHSVRFSTVLLRSFCPPFFCRSIARSGATFRFDAGHEILDDCCNARVRLRLTVKRSAATLEFTFALSYRRALWVVVLSSTILFTPFDFLLSCSGLFVPHFFVIRSLGRVPRFALRETPAVPEAGERRRRYDATVSSNFSKDALRNKS